MNNLKCLSKILIKNYIRKMNKKSFLINTIICFLPIIIINYFFRPYNIGFNLITVLYVAVLVFLYFKEVINIFFTFDDYEIYLGFPLSMKNIFYSKFVLINFILFIQNILFILCYFIDAFFCKKGFGFYIFIMIFYISLNVLFITLSYLIVLAYYKIKNSFSKKYVGSRYKDIIESIEKIDKKYKNKSYKGRSRLKSLVMIDLKKILRNKIIFRNFMIVTCIQIPLFCIELVVIEGKLPDFAAYLLALILVSVICISNMLASVAFSKAGLDQEFLMTFPLEKRDYMKSKIITSLIFNVPLIIIFSCVLFLSSDKGLIFKLVTIIGIILTVIAYVLLGICKDGENLNLIWFSKDDLFSNSFSKIGGQIICLSLTMIPFYIGPFFLKFLSFKIVVLAVTAILISIIIINYKKIIKLNIM